MTYIVIAVVIIKFGVIPNEDVRVEMKKIKMKYFIKNCIPLEEHKNMIGQTIIIV